MKRTLFFVIFLASCEVFAQIKIPPFPQNFPRAYKSLGYLQPSLQEIGADYCQQAVRAPDILPRISNPRYQTMLSQEINVAAIICKDGVYRGLPQTPGDKSLKFLTDLQVLKITTFKLFALYKEVPPSQITIEFVMKRLTDFETLTAREIIAAYTPPGSEGVYPPISDIAEWVRELHDLYGTQQIQ